MSARSSPKEGIDPLLAEAESAGLHNIQVSDFGPFDVLEDMKADRWSPVFQKHPPSIRNPDIGMGVATDINPTVSETLTSPSTREHIPT